MSIDEQEELFGQWIEEHEPLIHKVVRANAADVNDQDDLFQEIARQLWLSIPSFQGHSKVSTWIYRVALNTAFVWHRNRKRHRRSMVSANLDVEHSTAERSPSTEAEKRETLDWLYDEIRKMPKVDRSLTLLYLDEFSYQEIGEILGMSTNHVGVKLNRLKKKLANAFSRRTK